MKISLSWKLFGVLLFNAAVMVGVMAGAVHLSVSRNFEDYVHEFDRERFEAVVEVLEAEYAETQSWEVLPPRPQRWLMGLGFRPPMMRHEFFLQPFPDSGRDIFPERVFRRQNKMGDHPMMRQRRFILRKNQQSTRIRPLSTPPLGNRGPRDILILLDKNRNRLWGPELKQQPELFQALRYQDQVVGWLGMITPDSSEQSPPSHFLAQQQRMLKILVVAAVLTAAVIAFLLSRYLLRPLRKLTEGTHAVAERRFETRVNISSSDEFGQLASDFNAMAETLDSFEQQRRQWISDISHELGTPLSVLRGEIEALQDGVRQADSEHFESLHTEVMHLARIVDDLKLLSRAEAGQLGLNKIELDPVKLLDQTLEQYTERLTERGIVVQNQLSVPDVPAEKNESYTEKTASIDPVRFRQVFVNLLENVARYVHAPGTLTVRSQSAEDSLALILEDSGPGVPGEALPHLFDRFYRTDLSRNRETGGSGLGLAICKNLLEAHGGTIHAEAVEPQGLRIVINLTYKNQKSKNNNPNV